MTVDEAREIARERDEAYAAMRDAMARYDRARRAFIAMPLSFEDDR